MAFLTGISGTRDKKKRCLKMSRRTMFALMIGVCGLGVMTLTFYTQLSLRSTIAYVSFSNLTSYIHMGVLQYVTTTEDKNISTEAQFDDRQQLSNISLKNVSSSPAVINFTKIDNQTKTNGASLTSTKTQVRSVTTTMTFDKSLVVHCKESPFIQCAPPIVRMVKGKVFKVSLVRQPKWHPYWALNIYRCPYHQCQFEHDTITNKTDLVVVYGVWLRDKFQLPQRWSHQLYALSWWESPMHTYAQFLESKNSLWNYQFNLTMSYRVDSDIFSPYSRLKFSPKPLNKRPNYYEIAKRKTKTAVWMVSHCATQSKRELYVTEMQKYVDVDIYGGCGKPCPKKGTACGDLSTTYMFYLAFENSLCNDYISEKFFKFYMPGIHVIPVVRGGADYGKYFANFTFINANDFKTAKDLALYLKDLASDVETYSKYLEYKDLYVNGIDCIDIVCKICEYLHKHPVSEPKVYDLNSWVVNGQCHAPNDI